MIKKCKCCGKMFETKHGESDCCSTSCGNSYAAQKRHGIADEDIQPPASIRRAREADAEFMRRARIAKRDLDFRDSPYAPQVTVEEREFANSELGTIMRIETRGRVCLGWRSCGHISHNS